MRNFGLKTARKSIAIVALAGMMLSGLTACKSTADVLAIGEAAEKNPGPCPEAFALYETARLVEFKGAESFANIGFTAEINKVRSLCRYYGERPIEADLEMDIAFGRGPAASGQTATYEYFVAVTRKNIEVIEKEVFPITITFPAGQDTVYATETVGKIVIPRADETTSGLNFEIIVGFELTPEQIAFNGAGKRFRVSAGQK